MSDSHWKLPGQDPYAAATTLAAAETDAVFLTVSTPIHALSALELDSDAEEALLRRAWNAATACLPPGAPGKRMHWRGFLFVVVTEHAAAQRLARAILARLLADPELERTTWRVVATPIGADWQAAHEAAQADAHQELSITSDHVAAWIEPDGRGILRLAGS